MLTDLQRAAKVRLLRFVDLPRVADRAGPGRGAASALRPLCSRAARYDWRGASPAQPVTGADTPGARPVRRRSAGPAARPARRRRLFGGAPVECEGRRARVTVSVLASRSSSAWAMARDRAGRRAFTHPRRAVQGQPTARSRHVAKPGAACGCGAALWTRRAIGLERYLASRARPPAAAYGPAPSARKGPVCPLPEGSPASSCPR